ncbi:FAD/NAD(P)-binding protein [Arthrobacter rhizosphaerae]|uniref:FAD/NAD(P)-binding protein n=1 Tax=Arthrobacter rhizosphaerae TaxID=2855490 RepID=UPI001FF54C13|nr:FAD/NAD(P)-binding protein [Arthrobacter rhizosphaerae]
MRIAIIGLGAAGACMLDSIEQALGCETNISLTLYDPTDEPWVGRVFQADGDWVIANVPVPAMSLRHGDSSHAQRWLERKGLLDQHGGATDFFPRALYGRYIAEHADDLVQGMRRRGWHVEFVQEKATSLEPNGASGYTVGSRGRRDEHDYVILCAGGSVLSDPFNLASSEGYIADPYPARERLREIPPDAEVGVLGSGLTAVDVALSLKALGHAGPVRLYSRSGTLPLVRRPGPDWTAEHLTHDRILDISSPTDGLRLTDLEQLFDLEVQAWGGDAKGLFPPPQVDEPLEWLRWQLEHPHGSEDMGTFIFQKSVPFIWGDIWHALNPHDKQQVITSSMLRNITSRCCPMPRVNAEKLLGMLESGQASCRGGLQSVVPAQDGFDVHLGSTIEHVDIMVNAITPATYGVHPGVQGLVESAVGHGLARGHSQGGIEIAADTGAILGSTEPERVYALGDLTRGAFFFIFGLPALVRRSADIGAAISQDIRRKRMKRPVQAPPTAAPQPMTVG